MTIKPSVGAGSIRLDYQDMVKRLSEVSSGARVSLEKNSMSNPDHIEKWVKFWHARLRNFRSGDWPDASTLVDAPPGRHIMSKAVSRYLTDWARSDWIDDAEIEMLAIDLARLWPRDAELPVVVVSGSGKTVVKKLFIQAFSSHRNDSGLRLGEAFDGSNQKVAAG